MHKNDSKRVIIDAILETFFQGYKTSNILALWQKKLKLGNKKIVLFCENVTFISNFLFLLKLL